MKCFEPDSNTERWGSMVAWPTDPQTVFYWRLNFILPTWVHADSRCILCTVYTVYWLEGISALSVDRKWKINFDMFPAGNMNPKNAQLNSMLPQYVLTSSQNSLVYEPHNLINTFNFYVCILAYFHNGLMDQMW